MKKEVKNWWSRALNDWNVAKANLKIKKYNASSFFSHQAIEKALKALYIKRFNKIIKIHNLVTLAKKLELPSDLIDACDRVNPIYLETRYPDASGIFKKYSRAEALSDYHDSAKVLKWIKKKI